MDTSTFWIIFVLVLCAALFLKASKALLKILLIVGVIAYVVIKVLPQYL